jgi:hypothetical protein
MGNSLKTLEEGIVSRADGQTAWGDGAEKP